MKISREDSIKYQREVVRMVREIKEKMGSTKNADDDSKTDPVVAALLVSSDGKTIRSYRSELFEGDHAEYNLFMHKLAGENHSDDILFVSLEPCSHDSRITTISCCELINNAHIKQVYMGTFDPDKLVKGEGYTYLIEKGIEVELFDEEFQKELIDINKDFFISKTLTDDSFRRFNRDICKTEIDINSVLLYLMALDYKDQGRSLVGLSYESLKFEINEFRKNNLKNKKDIDIFEYFYTLVLKKRYVYESIINSKRVIESDIGFKLAFYKNPNHFYRGTCIRILDKSSSHEKKPLIFAESNLISSFMAIDKLYDMTKQFLSEDTKKNDLFKSLIREMTLNAVCHKSYSSYSPVIITLDKKCIKFQNPIAKDKIDLKALNDYSMPTNPINGSLADIAIEIGAMEGSGKGSDDLKKYIRLLGEKKNNLKAVYTLISDILIVSIPYPNIDYER